MQTYKYEFDEMQTQKRYKIRSQMLFITLILIMFDIWLYALGIRWLSYPNNIVNIIMLCGFLYYARLIAANAHRPQDKEPELKGRYQLIMIIGAIIYIIINLVVGISPEQVTDVALLDDYLTIVMYVVLGISILAMIIAKMIQKSKIAEINNVDES